SLHIVRGKVAEHLLKLVDQLSVTTALVLGQGSAQAFETRRRARASQHVALKALSERANVGTLAIAERRKRVFQQGEKRDRSESFRGNLGNEREEAARHALRQRLAGGIVDVDVPALELGGDAAGECAVRRHERRCLERRLHRTAQLKGNDLRFL